MEFEFIDSIYVPEEDLNAMCELVIKENCPIDVAVTEIAASWDDYEWMALEFIKERIIEEIKRRMKERGVYVD